MKGYGEKNSGEYVNGKHCAGWTTGWNAYSNMKNLFDGLGRSSDLAPALDMCHSDTAAYVFNLDENKDNKNDVIEWMISQTKKR